MHVHCTCTYHEVLNMQVLYWNSIMRPNHTGTLYFHGTMRFNHADTVYLHGTMKSNHAGTVLAQYYDVYTS